VLGVGVDGRRQRADRDTDGADEQGDGAEAEE
jgi:hypothetical protein